MTESALNGQRRKCSVSPQQKIATTSTSYGLRQTSQFGHKKIERSKSKRRDSLYKTDRYIQQGCALNVDVVPVLLLAALVALILVVIPVVLVVLLLVLVMVLLLVVVVRHCGDRGQRGGEGRGRSELEKQVGVGDKWSCNKSGGKQRRHRL
jgi:Flp pilus assembly protein TadB